MAATKRRNGDAGSPASRCSQAQASWSATAPPVMEAVRVPPSAWRTSQSMVIVHSPIAARSTQARNERPISRWISCVRPPTWPRSRRLRVLVARGSIPYSAVTQPAPLPFRHPGTPRSTEAVQSTFVRPAAIRHEPSAYIAALRSSVTGRSASALRPSFLTRPSSPVPGWMSSSGRRPGGSSPPALRPRGPRRRRRWRRRCNRPPSPARRGGARR